MFSRTEIFKKDDIRGRDSSPTCFVFCFLSISLLFSFFLHVMEFDFFVTRGPSGLEVGGRDGEQAFCLDAKLFWQASADFQLFHRSNWLTGSIHEEIILPRGSFGFEHDGMDENCPIGTDKWKRCILTSPGLKKICYSSDLRNDNNFFSLVDISVLNKE